MQIIWNLKEKNKIRKIKKKKKKKKKTWNIKKI